MGKVTTSIMLVKEVEDLDQAEDWQKEVKELLVGHTECEIRGRTINHMEPEVIEK